MLPQQAPTDYSQIPHRDATPAHQLRAPGDVGVLAIDKEVGVEKFAVERNALDHLAPVQRRRRRSSEYILVLQVMAVVHFLAATVEVAQHRVEVNAGGIDQ